MREIKAEFERIQSDKYSVGWREFFSRKHKRSREWDVLGALQKLLRAARHDAPEFALESETADFYTFHSDGSPSALVEIVEILPPGYKRQDRYKRGSEEPLFWVIRGHPDRIKQPWLGLRRQILSKAKKPYPSGTCLVAYFDIGRMSFDDWTTPFHEQLFVGHTSHNFEGVEAFSRVLVISSDMKCLVQLAPSFVTIVPDANDPLAD